MSSVLEALRRAEQMRAELAERQRRIEREGAADLRARLDLLQETPEQDAECDGQAENRKRETHTGLCGARRRSDGQPCQAGRARRPDGSTAPRCRFHGGASTGPTTAEGRARIAASNARRRKHAPRPPAPVCALQRPNRPCHARAVLDPRTGRPWNGYCQAHGGLEDLPVPTLSALRLDGEIARGVRSPRWNHEAEADD